MRDPQRWRRLLPAIWLGALLVIAGIATPAAFAVLPAADAGRVAGRILANEATLSVVLGGVVAVLERQAARLAAEAGQGPQFSTGLMLALGAVFCTVVGYYGLQPMMAAARAGQGALSFGQLHAVSAVFYALKVLLVAALAWRASR